MVLNNILIQRKCLDLVFITQRNALLSICCHKVSCIENIDLKPTMQCDQETQWLTLLWCARRNTNKVRKIN